MHLNVEKWENVIGNFCSLSIKFGRFRQLMKSSKVCKYLRSMSFHDFMMTKCSKIKLQVSVLRTNGPLVFKKY